MEITLVQKGKAKKTSLPQKRTVRDLIKSSALNEETFVIKLNGRLAHPSERLREGDVLEFVGIKVEVL